MDTLPEVNQRLREVEVAIQAAVTGASYSIEGQQVTRQDLPALYGERNRLYRLKDQLMSGSRNDYKVATFPWAG